jgi:hypothetical protein
MAATLLPARGAAAPPARAATASAARLPPPAAPISIPGATVEPNSAFSFVADRGMWDVFLRDDGRAFIGLDLIRIPHRIGVGRVTKVRRVDPATGKPSDYADPTPEIDWHRRTYGRELVPHHWDVEAFGAAVQANGGIGYCRALPAPRGGLHHRTPWEGEPYRGPGGVALFRFDWDGYEEFLARCAKELFGLSAPPPAIVEAKRVAIEAKMRRYPPNSRGYVAFEARLNGLDVVAAAELAPVAEPAQAPSGPTARELELQRQIDELMARLQPVAAPVVQPAPVAESPKAAPTPAAESPADPDDMFDDGGKDDAEPPVARRLS